MENERPKIDKQEVHLLTKENKLWIKPGKQGKTSLFRALSNSIYLTDVYHDKIVTNIYEYLVFENMELNLKFYPKDELDFKKRFANDPGDPKFMNIVLEIFSKIYRTQVKLLFIENGGLVAKTFSKKVNGSIKILQLSDHLYAAAFDEKYKEIASIAQNIALSLIDASLDRKKFHFEDFNGGRYINFDVARHLRSGPLADDPKIGDQSSFVSFSFDFSLTASNLSYSLQFSDQFSTASNNFEQLNDSHELSSYFAVRRKKNHISNFLANLDDSSSLGSFAQNKQLQKDLSNIDKCFDSSVQNNENENKLHKREKLQNFENAITQHNDTLLKTVPISNFTGPQSFGIALNPKPDTGSEINNQLYYGELTLQINEKVIGWSDESFASNSFSQKHENSIQYKYDIHKSKGLTKESNILINAKKKPTNQTIKKLRQHFETENDFSANDDIKNISNSGTKLGGFDYDCAKLDKAYKVKFDSDEAPLDEEGINDFEVFGKSGAIAPPFTLEQAPIGNYFPSAHQFENPYVEAQEDINDPQIRQLFKEFEEQAPWQQDEPVAGYQKPKGTNQANKLFSEDYFKTNK